MGSEQQAEPSRRLTPERWRDVNRVVDVALELRPEERHEYIARECAQDAELRREVEQFLKACDNLRDVPGFLGEPASQYGAPLIAQVDHNDEQVGAAVLRMITAALAPRYIIERELGRGGMARVYLAHDNELDRRVAIKLMNDDLSRTMGAEQFRREIRITASLRHLNIVPVYDSGNVEGFLYYVMPHIEGESLFAKLRRDPKLSLADALRIVRDVADALDYAHAHGIVHRDVKPQNILIESGRALVTDFGVAIVVSSMSADPVTQSVALGTPKYMSPEQASGDQELSPRSDVYALGVVLYEMLAGEPPYSGGSAQAVLAKHMHAPIPDIRILRRSLGGDVQRVIERALAKVPADRYATTGDLARDFEAAVTATTAAAADGRRLAGIGVVTALAVALGLLARFGPTIITSQTPSPRMDTTRVAFLPLHRDPVAQQRAADDAMFREGLSRWRGVVVLDRSTTDALAKVSSSTSVARASAAARSLGAGRFIRGSIVPRGNTWRAEVALFDAETGRALHQTAVDVPEDATSAKRAYEQLADELLLRGNEDTTQERRFWSLSLPAMQAMRHGQRALEAWDLVVADSLFQVSVGLDPGYPRANLLLSQVRAWRSLPASSWSTLAERAHAGIGTLPELERRLALPLVLLARREFAAACREYEKLESADPRDFAAKFGLGQCRTMDKVVIPDAASPSGARFRSSYDRAVVKYAEAFEILPSVHHGYEHDGFARLRALLFVSTDLVNGYGADKQRTLYHARPSLQGDTLALIPYRWDKVFAGGNRTIPSGFEEALARQRTAFRKITDSWSIAFPRSSGAKLAVGIALELLHDASAIDTIRLARRLAEDSTRELDSIRELRLAAMEALLRVKFGVPNDTAELRKARALIDSALARPVTLASEASILAPLAALTGRCQLAEDLFRRVDPAIAGLPGAHHLFTRSQALLARSALGCADRPSAPTLADFAATIERENAGASADERRWMDAALLFRPALLSSTLDSAVIERLAAESQNQLLLAARALVRRDSSRARQELTAFGAQWNRTIGVTPDIGYVEATFWARLRDTTAAMLWLDRTLGSARTYDPAILADPTRAAVFVRAMLLRAELAQQRGDLPTARRWAAAVAIMWSGADEDLRPSMQRLERIASSR